MILVRVPPLCRALGLLYHHSFQQVSNFLVNVFPSSIEGSRVYRRLPPALLNLIVYVVCPRLRALGVEVRWTRASGVIVFVGLLSFASSGSL